MTFFLYRILFGVLFWIWVILTLVLTSIPGTPEVLSGQNETGIRFDYIEHFVIYFLTPIFYILWKIGPEYRLSPGQIRFIILTGTGFAVFTEVHQFIIPGRVFNPVDMLFNILGVLAGIATGYYVVVRNILAGREKD